MGNVMSSSGGIVRSVIDALSAILIEVGIFLMVGVWTVMWIFLGKKTAQVQGTLEAVIIGIYTLIPVIGVILWRLSVWTDFEIPGVGDLAGTPAEPIPDEPDEKSEVAQRFETGE